MKEEKCAVITEVGVTLVALTVTIIVLLILASIGFYGGKELIAKSQDKKAIAELGMVQHAVLEQYVKYKTTNKEELLKGTTVSIEEAKATASQMGVTLKGTNGFYRLLPSQLQEIGINNAEDTYIVNYTTGEVMNSTQLKTNAGGALYIAS